jgi:hypothetical protein
MYNQRKSTIIKRKQNLKPKTTYKELINTQTQSNNDAKSWLKIKDKTTDSMT